MFNDASSVIEDQFDTVAFGTTIFGLYPEISNTIDNYRKLGLYDGRDEYGRLMLMPGTATPVRDVKGARTYIRHLNKDTKLTSYIDILR